MIIYDPKITGSFQINGSTISSVESIDSVSGSVVDLKVDSGSFSTRVSLVESSVDSLNTASSSYLLNTTDTLDGDLTVTGKITAQEFHTEFVSASIIYQSGSTKFGDSIDDTHQFTGSLNISGSSNFYPGITVTGDGSNHIIKAVRAGTTRLLVSNAVNTVGINTDTINNPLTVNGGADFSGNVGIGETSPFGKLHIKGSDTGVTAPSAQGNLLVLEDAENGLSILSSTAGAGYINFGDSDDNDVGMILYGHSSNTMAFWTNAGKRMTINSKCH